ncbi:MAG: 3'(2'),5'-bisphosphate nucleotidase [Candidatus Dadabacteria bacterium]|nr:3'(2'),5'-bisphosphate nucleotidase [Candidatus Dadabacteria bacterium]NIQ13469.1 3'(2'),5'-bisphosphate nucleotidase [Candidatus Dadabacteria bacterium]
MDLVKEREIAIKSVLKACKLCIKVQQNLISDESVKKNDKSPVTVADFGVQAIINKDLSRNFTYPIVAEEDSAYLRSNEGELLADRIKNYLEEYMDDESKEEILDYIDRGNYSGGKEGKFWTLDPIDGTKGFLRKDQYAIALALLQDGEVVLGILGCPNLEWSSHNSRRHRGCILIAEKGKGSSIRDLNDPQESMINVSKISNTRMASFCESVESSHSSHNDSAKIAKILNVENEPVRIDSQCKYAVIGKGDASIYLRLPTSKDYEEKIWDHAAGYIIVKEAGGEVTDCHGKQLDFSLGKTLSENKGIVSTNGIIHKEVIDAVNKIVII